MNESRKLLEDYARRGSEAAFRELTARYVNLVHSTALRLVNGDSHLAEDVTQTVFLNLARKAGTLSGEVMIGGWLHRNACFVASTMMRGDRRRQLRERQAVEMNATEDHSAANLAKVAPLLDDAINQLGPEDRAAILLRFFEQLEFRAIGETMGVNEDAARMRVNRALDKLHSVLTRPGVTLSAAALGAALGAEAVKAAPIGMAASVATAALGGAATGGATLTLIKLLSMTKIKIAIATALAVAALAAPAVLQHQSLAKLREENQILQQQSAQMAALQTENERLSNLVVQATVSPAPSEKQVHELARLRDEVGRLREQTNDMAKLKERISQLRVNQPALNGGRRAFRGMTMAELAKFIGGVLQAPVADQTGLTGTYDIQMTPPRAGGEDGKLERVTGILLNELGLKLIPFAGPFTSEEEAAASEREVVTARFPDGTTLTNVGSTRKLGNGGFALKLDHSDAPGLKSSGESEPGPQNLPAGLYEADTLGLSPAVANNLRMIDSSKQQWGLMHRKQLTDTPTWGDLQPFLGRGPNQDMSAFTNVADGEYIIGSMGVKPQFRGDPKAGSPFYYGTKASTEALTAENKCINNLRLFDSAKQQWALEHRKTRAAAPTMEDLLPYIGRGLNGEPLPVCPDGGAYTLGTVGEKPTCSIKGHDLP